jgi:hypothetical protein
MATEGTLESYIDRRKALWESVTGITKAFKEPPAALQDAQLPAVVIEAGSGARGRSMQDTLTAAQRITETVYLRRAGTHISDTPIGSSGWALIDAVDATFFMADRNDLNGVPQTSVQNVTPPTNNGFELLPYGPQDATELYIAIRFTTDVQFVRVF